MRRKGRFKAFLENTAITYRPPTLKAPETPLSRELDALERLVRSGFREGSIFGGEQRGTPTLCHSTFSPDGESISTFAIISSVTRRRTIERTASPTTSSIKSTAALVAVVSRRGSLKRDPVGRAKVKRRLLISDRAAVASSSQRIAYWLIIDISTRIRPRGRPHLDYIGATSRKGGTAGTYECGA